MRKRLIPPPLPGIITLSKIGALLGVDYSAVSISRKRLQTTLSDSPQRRATMAPVEERAGRGKEVRAEKTG